MDSFVEQKLEEWNLSCLKVIFQENMIDEEAFRLLDHDSIKEMITAIGPRRKLLKKLEEEKAVLTMDSAISVTQLPDAPPPIMCNQQASTSNVTAISPSENTEISPKRFKPDFNIRSILEKSIPGENILKDLGSGNLSRNNRLKMVQILVAELMTMFGDRPKSDIKIAMARAVVEEFPFLKDEEGQGFEAWYTPGKGLHSATGWLEEKLRNMRRRTNQEKNKTNISSSSATVSKSKLVQFTSLPESSISEEDYEGMVEWLKHHVEPLTKVKEFMSKTSVKRASWIREHSDLSVGAILKEHPRLIDTPGMIELDFALVLPESVSDNLFLKWTPSFAVKVIKYAEDQAKWQVYLGINMEQINSDEAKQNVALSILPCILPAGRKCKKRCSIDDALSSFIDVKPIGTNIPKYLEDNLKPHILVLGERLHPHQVFLVCEGKCLERSNLVEAVDSCFKLFYVLDMEYPWQSNVTWEFFQKVVFCLEDKTPRKTTSAVISMRATLNSYA